MTERVQMIYKNLKAVQDWRNSYENLKRRPYKFWCGIICTIDRFTDRNNYEISKERQVKPEVYVIVWRPIEDWKSCL